MEIIEIFLIYYVINLFIFYCDRPAYYINSVVKMY